MWRKAVIVLWFIMACLLAMFDPNLCRLFAPDFPCRVMDGSSGTKDSAPAKCGALKGASVPLVKVRRVNYA